MPVIRDLVVDIGLTIRRLKSIAHGGRVLNSILPQAADRNPSAVQFAHPIEARRPNLNRPSIFQWKHPIPSQIEMSTTRTRSPAPYCQKTRPMPEDSPSLPVTPRSARPFINFPRYVSWQTDDGVHTPYPYTRETMGKRCLHSGVLPST